MYIILTMLSCKPGKTIGSGSQGKVCDYGHSVVKLIPKNSRSHQEIEITTKLQGVPGVVELLGVDEDDTNYLMTMKRYDRVCSIPDLKSYSRDILQTLHHVHHASIAHCDLKFSNVMQDSQGRYVLIDFGSAVDMTDPDPIRVSGTPMYLSIESLSSIVDTRSDMWSFGVMLYKCHTHRYPFTGTTLPSLYRSILSCSPDYDCIDSADARDFISNLLSCDIETRMTPMTALNHRWLR